MPPVALQELELQSGLFKEAALQLPGVVSRLESLQMAVHQQQQQHSAVASQAEVDGLRGQLKAMQRTVTSLTEELHTQAASKAGEGLAAQMSSAAVLECIKRLLGRSWPAASGSLVEQSCCLSCAQQQVIITAQAAYDIDNRKALARTELLLLLLGNDMLMQVGRRRPLQACLLLRCPPQLGLPAAVCSHTSKILAHALHE